jgi:hypothetical protein
VKEPIAEPRPNYLFQKERTMNEKKAVLVIGAGDATCGTIARRFAREG